MEAQLFPRLPVGHCVQQVPSPGFGGIPQLFGISGREPLQFQPVHHQGHGLAPHLFVVGGQLLFVHLAGISGQHFVKPHGCRSQVVDGAQVRRAHHIVILAARHVAHQVVCLGAVEEVARSTPGKQVGEPSQQALGGHVAVLVLLPVPAVEQEVRANFHQGKHSRLHDLAGHGPVQLFSGPLYFGPVFVAGFGLVPCPLCLVVAHRIRQDAVVLEPLGREHGQRLHQLAVAALDACPLHGGVVGLRLLDDPLVHLVYRFPVGLTSSTLGSPVRGAPSSAAIGGLRR